MNLEDIERLNNLNYTFNLNQRFVSVKDEQGNNYKCQTPFLRVLKPIHITLNKKKTIANKYIILETSDDLDFNNQIGDFLYIVNKIHEVSQEKIKQNSLEWFNTEFDEIGLDIKVKRPIDQQRDSEFMRICIPLNNDDINNKIKSLSKGDYILSNIIFKGLKVSNDYITEEWELDDFMTQEMYENNYKTDITCKEDELIDIITNTDIKEIKEITENEVELEEVIPIQVTEIENINVDINVINNDNIIPIEVTEVENANINVVNDDNIIPIEFTEIKEEVIPVEVSNIENQMNESEMAPISVQVTQTEFTETDITYKQETDQNINHIEKLEEITETSTVNTKNRFKNKSKGKVIKMTKKMIYF